MAQLNRCPVVVANFDQFPILEVVERYQITQIVSFSALQWSKDLEGLLQKIGKSGRRYLLLLFTGESFQQLHRRLGITSPLPREREILEWAHRHLPNLHSAPLSYTLHFPSPRELFRYLRGSGVSGGVRVPVPKLWALRKNPPLLLESRLLLLSSEPEPVEWFRQFAPGIESYWEER
jgi:malonyl-CoA O-methyltransferase